jgi:hypothetical protein
MAITFNERTVAAQPTDTGVVRQRLITDERVKGANVLLDRFMLAGGATMRLDLSAKSLAWLQVLEGMVRKVRYWHISTDRISITDSRFRSIANIG